MLKNKLKKTNNNLVKKKSEEKAKKDSSFRNSRKPQIKLHKVDKYYMVGRNNIHVLKDINIEVYPNEFIVILGPSGSGKSTLLNVLLGLEYPTSGQVLIEGEDITYYKMNRMAKFRFEKYGIVFQRADWVRSLNVVQNVALPLFINDWPKKKSMEIAWSLVKKIGMEDHAHYNPTELSGGQQQKICLARALVNDPPIIVADEPTGNLDTVSSEKVMNMFKELNEENKKTIIMVTHNIDYVRYASRTIYVRDGRIVDSSEGFMAKT